MRPIQKWEVSDESKNEQNKSLSCHNVFARKDLTPTETHVDIVRIFAEDFGLAVRVFANGPGDLGSIPDRVIPKTQKWYLMHPCLKLSIIRYGSRVKWSNPEKGVAPFPTPWCSSYQKGNLLVTLDYGRQLTSFLCNCEKVVYRTQ